MGRIHDQTQTGQKGGCILSTASYPNGMGGQIVNNEPQPNTWRTLAILPIYSNQLPPVYPGLPQEYAYMVDDLLHLWAAKLYRNQLRMRYYNGRNVLKDFGISIPPQLLNVETVVGWPQKAVDQMAVRSRFDGFSATYPEVQDMLDGISRRSRLNVKYRQAVQSALIHSCCFASVMMDEYGEPRIDLHSAETAAARWDDAKGRIAYGLTIDAFEDGIPSAMTLHTEDAVVTFALNDQMYDWEVHPIDMGRPTMDAISYRPTYRRPFGQSRINRAVMSLTDSAVREALRTEISAEFFTSPQKYLLGADEATFEKKTKWEAYIGNIFAVGRDENGDLPQFGQLSQGTMQPHTDYMRSLASRFSGETNIPVSCLGIIHDQPASAEAIYAANEPLIIEVEDFNDGARETLRTLACMAMAAKLDVPLRDLPYEYTDFTPDFRNPAMPSVVSQTDAMVKIASVVPGFAGTDVFFEQIGFPEDMRRKAMTEIQSNMGLQIAAAVNGDAG